MDNCPAQTAAAVGYASLGPTVRSCHPAADPPATPSKAARGDGPGCRPWPGATEDLPPPQDSAPRRTRHRDAARSATGLRPRSASGTGPARPAGGPPQLLPLARGTPAGQPGGAAARGGRARPPARPHLLRSPGRTCRSRAPGGTGPPGMAGRAFRQSRSWRAHPSCIHADDPRHHPAAPPGCARAARHRHSAALRRLSLSGLGSGPPASWRDAGGGDPHRPLAGRDRAPGGYCARSDPPPLHRRLAR